MGTLKYVIPALVGAGVAYGVWRLTRSEAPSATDGQGDMQGIAALRGYTQGPSFAGPNLLRPLASAGLQQIYFKK